jgi:Zonular occludens toxin (Zot)
MQNKIIGVVAPKGSGKTTRVAELVRVTPRVAIYDPMGATDYQYRSVASHIVSQDLALAHQAMAEERFQILYEPQPPTQDGEEWFYPDFTTFIAKCWRRCQLIGPMMLIVDEAHYTMSKRTMPLEMWNIITNGRRYGLDVVWITQRFVGVNGWVRANADEYWFFRLVHPADLQTVNEICGSDVMEQVRNLRRLDAANPEEIVPGQLLRWNSLDGSVIIEDLNDGKPKRSHETIDRGRPGVEETPGNPSEPPERENSQALAATEQEKQKLLF